MSDSDIALAAIDSQIEARDKKIAKLRPALTALEQEREALAQTRAILAAASPNGHHKPLPPTPPMPAKPVQSAPAATARRSSQFSPSPVLEAVDEILKDRELHIEDIVKAVHDRGYKTSKAVLTTSLARRAAKGKRYRRVKGKPNTFALLKGGEQEAKE